MNTIDVLLNLVDRADFPEIEFARDEVTSSDLGALAAAYDSLDTWEQKAALINLVQDHLDPRFRPLMLDFLKAPDPENDETITLTKAIALCHLDENFDDFMRYYNDRNLLKTRVQEYLEPSASTQTPRHTPTANRKTAPQNSPWQILGVTALIIGLGFIVIALNNLFTLQKYRQAGIIVEASVTDKWEQDNETCIAVSYFDKDLLDGGDLYLTEICSFISDETWSVARKNATLEVVYLPEDPQNNTILAAALNDNQIPGFSVGGLLVLMGLLALGWQRLKDR